MDVTGQVTKKRTVTTRDSLAFPRKTEQTIWRTDLKVSNLLASMTRIWSRTEQLKGALNGSDLPNLVHKKIHTIKKEGHFAMLVTIMRFCGSCKTWLICSGLCAF